jgi:predicted anti-sigma-YlaC factor YlaD
MSEHLTARKVERYGRRALSPLELIETDAHLASCVTCRQLLSEKEGAGAAINHLRAGLRAEETAELEHPSHVQLAAHADRQLDEVDRELIDGHLLLCSECAGVMHDLQGFLEMPLPAPDEPAAGYQAEERRAQSRKSLLQSLLSSWRSYTEWMPLRAVGATAALLLFVGVGAVVWYGVREKTAEGTRVARVSPPPVANVSPQPTSEATPSPTVEQPGANTGAIEGVRPPRPAAKRNSARTEQQSVGAYTDGVRVNIDSGGRVSGLASLNPTDRRAVERALQTQRIEAPALLASVSGGAETLRGGGGQGVSFPVLGPVGTAVITDRPTFRWRALSGASSYVVSVFDRDFRKVAASAPQADTEWTVALPLARGQVYSWHVSASWEGREVTSPEQPAPEAKFVVLDGAKAEELSRAGQVYKDSHLTMGTLYARAGLLDEAERELQSALRENPGSKVARKLLLSVQALRGPKR